MFVPGAGTLIARMFENHANGVANSLVYDIAIPVRCALDLPPEIERQTEVRLDFIRIGLVDWRDLPGRTWTFSVNPEIGFVDGSVYFNGAHHYANLMRVSFGPLNDETLKTAVTIAFHVYRDSGLPDLPETLIVDWDVDLTVAPVELDQVIAAARAALGSR
jgi:hypothetical protein